MIEKIYNKIIKNKKNTMVFILVLALITSIPAFAFPGIRSGHDTYFHLSRISAVADNIKELNFFKGVYSGYINDYGYANGLFYPDIFLYIPALFVVLGVNVIFAYKIFLFIINFFSILFIYKVIKGISKNNYASILGSIVYAFSAYRLVDMYQRSALGETLAFVFIPLIIYGIYEIVFEDKKKFYILTLGMSGLILSHVVSTYIIGILLFVFCLINIKQLLKEKRILYLILAALMTLLITSFFLMPMLEQMMSQTFYYTNTASVDHFQLFRRTVPFYSLFIEIPSLRTVLYDKYWIPSGIGLIFLYFIYMRVKHREIKNKFIDELYIISIVTLLPITITPFWKLGIVKKTLYMIQFPWRFYIVPTLLLTVAGSIFISKITESKKILKYTLLLSCIPLGTMICFSAMDKRINGMKEYTAASAEYLPVEVDKDFPYARGNIIVSNNKIEMDFEKNGTTMNINFKQNSKDTYLELPLIYYKGYEAKINKTNLETFKTENGFVAVRVNDIKEGKINVKYTGTKLAKITKIISSLSIAAITVYIIRKEKYEK